MHRFSALFNKRLKDRKHRDSSDVDDDTLSCPHEGSSDSSGSFRSPPRLVRSPAIRPSRYSDEVKVPVLSLNGTDHSGDPASTLTPGVRSTSNLSSRYSNVVQTGSPLPSPPRSPAQAAIPVPSLWPLPSPRQHPKKHEESTHLQLVESGHQHSSLWDVGWSEGDTTRHFQGLPSPSGIPFASPRIGGMGSGSLGVGLDSYAGSVPSTPNGRSLRPVRTPRGSVPQEESWRWAPEQASHGENRVIDEFPGPDHSPRSEYQNGLSSRHTGHSSRHAHKVGTPNTASPPLSPSAARASSPGGWIKGHLLGSGAFGKVYKGINSETGEFCAIKEVEFVQNDSRSRESAKQLEKEIASLSSLHHPNIVQYKGSEVVGNSLYIYLELVSGGSLYKLYQEFKKLEEPVIRRYTRQILLGLQFLHSRKFVHRDIKCANILVDQDGTVKLADFGVAKYIKEQGVPFSMKGSPHWMAPEVIMSKNTGFEYGMDIWSLGCTVIEMATGKPPWGGLEAAAAMFKVIKMGAPPIPESLSPEGQSFVRLCLQINPGDRPTASALLTHRFVQIQNDGQDTGTIHAFDDRGEAYASSSVLGMHPSLSAPSSPGPSHPGVGELYVARSDLALHSRGKLGDSSTVNWEQEPFERVSVWPQEPRRPKHTRKKSPGFSRTRHHSSELPRGQAWPLSEPTSPNSKHGTPTTLHPTRSAELLPGFPMHFSQDRRNQQASPEMSQGFGRARLPADREFDKSWRQADGNRF